jgi:predicted aconitase
VVTSLLLDDRDRALLSGEEGPARRIAMSIVVEMARVLQAPHLIDIESAHVDACMYNGQAGLDFVELLESNGGRVAVPTTLNAGSLDLLHPELRRAEPEVMRAARRQMDAYVSMGCQPTFTCAPYLLPVRPSFGSHVAWAESNAIAFANSVLGARTDRYGDFFDICAALTGRVPYVGLHLAENRRATAAFRLPALPPRLLCEDSFYQVLGYLLGELTGAHVPVVTGLALSTTEDQLRAIGSAAASSGSVALFHVVGVTPEAATLDVALQGVPAVLERDITFADLLAARDALSTSISAPLSAVCVGAPHFSIDEFAALRFFLRGRHIHDTVRLYASTGRQTLATVDERGWLTELEALGVRLVADTCTYFLPAIEFGGGAIMTNSAKWAHYAPGGLGVQVAFGSLEECVESAVSGRIERDDDLWHPA